MGTAGRLYTGFTAKTACPRCAANGDEVPVVSSHGKGYACQKGHSFKDMEVLREELSRVRPGVVKSSAPRIISPGQCKIDVIVRESVRDKLAQKYGDRLEATVASMLSALCEDYLLFAGDDLKMLRDGLGEKTGNAFELAARAKSIRADVALLQNNMEAPAASRAVIEGPGTFRVKLSDEHTKQVQELAKERNIRAEKVLADGIEWNLNSNNF